MTRFLLWAGIALVLFILPPASAKESWLYVKTAHLDVLSNCSKRRTAEILVKLETFHAAVVKLVGHDTRRERPLHLIIYRNDDELEPYLPRYKGKVSNAAAIFSRDTIESTILMSGESLEQDNRSFVLHEYTHEILTEEGFALPLWLNEGLAEFFSTFRQEADGQCFFGDAITDHVDFLSRGGLMPLEELFSADEHSAIYNEGVRQGLFYAESWAVLHFWLCGDSKEFSSGFPKFLSGVQTKQPMEPLFRESFKCDYATMLRDLRSYVGFGSPYHVLAMRLPVVDYEKALQFRPATPYEVSLGKVRSRWHGNLAEDTESKLLELQKTYPGPHPEIEEILSVVSLRKKKAEQAFEYWEKACEQGSTNPIILERSVRRVLEPRFRGDSTSFMPEDIAAPLRERTERALVASPQSLMAWENLILIEALVEKPHQDVVRRARENLAKLKDRLVSTYAIALVLFHDKRFDACITTCKALAAHKDTPAYLKELSEELERRAVAAKEEKARAKS